MVSILCLFICQIIFLFSTQFYDLFISFSLCHAFSMPGCPLGQAKRNRGLSTQTWVECRSLWPQMDVDIEWLHCHIMISSAPPTDQTHWHPKPWPHSEVQQTLTCSVRVRTDWTDIFLSFSQAQKICQKDYTVIALEVHCLILKKKRNTYIL